MELLTKDLCKHFVKIAGDGIAERMQAVVDEETITTQDYVVISQAWNAMESMLKGMKCFWGYMDEKHDSHARHDHDEHEDNGRMRR